MLRSSVPGTSPYLYNKLTDIFLAGYSSPIYHRLFHHEDERLCFWVERFWIDVIGRSSTGNGTLCNLTDGGDGVPLTEDLRKKRAETQVITNSRPEVKERRRKAVQEIHKNPQIRDKRIKSLAVTNATPQTRERRRAGGVASKARRTTEEKSASAIQAWVTRRLNPDWKENTKISVKALQEGRARRTTASRSASAYRSWDTRRRKAQAAIDSTPSFL